MLRSVVLFLTYACNYKCPYCWERNDEKFKAEKFRPAKEWAEALNRLEPKIVDFTGGEPFIMPDFMDLLLLLKPSIKIAVTTNLTFDVTQFLKDPRIYTSIFHMTLSFHPSQGVDVDAFSFKALRLRTAGVPISVNFVAHPDQIAMIPALKKHFDGLGIAFHVDPFATKTAVDYTDEQKEILKTYTSPDRIPDATPGEKHLCDGGQHHLNVQPNGDAFRCILDKHLGVPMVGNIFSQAFKLNEGATLCEKRYACPGCDKDKTKVVKQ